MEKMNEYYQKKILPNLDKVISVALIIGFAVLGIFSSEYSLYFFGLIFFLAGFYAGSYGPKAFGLFFLFSHGGTGLSFMLYTLCSKYMNNPRFTDSPNFMHYVVIVVLTIFIATACVFVSNLTNPFDSEKIKYETNKQKKMYRVLPLAIYFLATLLTVIFLRRI